MGALVGLLVKIANVVVCADPARYRREWPVQRDEELRGAALVSGMLEFLLGAPGTLFYVGTAIAVAKSGFGVAGLILNPFLPSVFLLVEGGVRFLAAISGQILPTLPIQIIAWIHDAKEGKQVALQLGPPIPDKIERGEGKPWDVRVLSCRGKPHWNSYMTIRFDGEFYQMMQEDISAGARKFVYLLRKHPANRLVVVVYAYDPKDVMTPDALPRRWKPGDSGS